MKSVPKDEAVLDALFRVISSEKALAAHISNASLPNSAVHHNGGEVVSRYKENAVRYIETVIRAGRRFLHK